MEYGLRPWVALTILYCTWFDTYPQTDLVTTNTLIIQYLSIYIYIYIYIRLFICHQLIYRSLLVYIHLYISLSISVCTLCISLIINLT